MGKSHAKSKSRSFMFAILIFFLKKLQPSVVACIKIVDDESMLMLSDPSTGLQVIDLQQQSSSLSQDEQDSMAGIDLADLSSVLLQGLDTTSICANCDCTFCRLSSTTPPAAAASCDADTDDQLQSHQQQLCTQEGREACSPTSTSKEPVSCSSLRPPFMCTYWSSANPAGTEWEVYRGKRGSRDVSGDGRLAEERLCSSLGVGSATSGLDQLEPETTSRRRRRRQKHKCPSCSDVFSWYSTLSGHAVREHPRPWWCDGIGRRRRRQCRRAEAFAADTRDGCWKCRMNRRDSAVFIRSLTGLFSFFSLGLDDRRYRAEHYQQQYLTEVSNCVLVMLSNIYVDV